MSNTKNVTINFPIFHILGLIFITLKLTGYITWSWWWVLAPFWGPVAFIVIVGLIVAIGAMILAFFDKK